MDISECSRKNPGLINGGQHSCLTDSRKKCLIIDDESMIRLSLKKLFEKEGALALTAGSGAAALKIFEEEKPQIVVLDVRLPDCSGIDVLKTIKTAVPETVVIMITGHADIKSSVEAMKIGASDFLEKPLDFAAIGSIIRALVKEKPQEDRDHGMFDFVCAGDSMKEVMRIADSLAAKSDVTILLLGESGTGKNVLSRRIHELSSRRHMPFVEIGCSQIPDHLLESELFGYKKGAFTDARESKKGLFELAQGGTILLDEIGDMPLQMQSKILTMIEEKKFRSIGGLDYHHADVRILAATNRDLPELVQSKKFRLDLFYRLNVAAIEIPPLRERKKDIPLLIDHYIKGSCEKYGVSRKALSEEAVSCLQEYDWPGNVRELKNMIERVVILSKEDRIGNDDIKPCLFNGRGGAAPEMSGSRSRNSTSLREMEEFMIQEAFELSNGNQRKTAKLLDISRDTLRYRLKKMGLTKIPEKGNPNK
jgi:two-component system, NtrC family, response regulator AtoC